MITSALVILLENLVHYQTLKHTVVFRRNIWYQLKLNGLGIQKGFPQRRAFCDSTIKLTNDLQQVDKKFVQTANKTTSLILRPRTHKDLYV